MMNEPRRLLLTAVRLLGAMLWPGLEPHRPWPLSGGHRRARLLWRLLPWLAGLYALIVAIAAAGGVINDAQRMNGGLAFLLLLPLVAGAALAATRPLDGWRAVTLWLLVVPFALPPPAGLVPPLEPWEWCLWVPVLLFVGIERSGREALAIGALSALALCLRTFVTPWPVHDDYLTVALLGAAIPLVIGSTLGSRLSAQRALAAEQARAAAAQAEQGALAERARIAREMHDVVAHHMSMIAVRCETAPYRLTDLNETGRVEIAEIGAAARAAMTEMQRLLGVLRSTDGGAELAPQPSLTDLPDLIRQARSAGVELWTSLEVDLDSVPESIGLSVYRIAQEALTNARVHAPGAPVSLRLRHTSDGLELHVRSDPSDSVNDATRDHSGGHPRRHGGGHGLVGMRERAALHGGELIAGPDPDGGFTVRAVLPLEEPTQPHTGPTPLEETKTNDTTQGGA